MSLFNSPFLLGFDNFERTIDRISKLSSDSYPPYNIEQISPNTLRITVAVAGFNKKDLDISLEGNQLQIRGGRPEEAEADAEEDDGADCVLDGGPRLRRPTRREGGPGPGSRGGGGGSYGHTDGHVHGHVEEHQPAAKLWPKQWS